MSSRALKRQQKKQQELEVEESEAEEVVDLLEQEHQVTQKFSSFSLLDIEEDVPLADESESDEQTLLQPPSSTKTKAKKKEKKQKAVQSEDKEEDLINFPSDLDDVEEEEEKGEGEETFAKNPFEIDFDYLDPEVELREKMSNKAPKKQSNKNKNNIKKSKLTLAGPVSKQLGSHGLHELGFSFVKKNDASASLEEYFMEFDEEYELIRAQLVHFVQTGDVEGIMELLRDNPCHLDTLLVASDILKHHSTPQASLLLSKAIHLVHKRLNLLDLPRLSYGKAEGNRCVHLALFRRVQFLLKQGCWRTALQVAKALYALDTTDPLQIELILQFLALQTSDDALFAYFQDSTSPGWRLTRLYKNFDSHEMKKFLEEYPEFTNKAGDEGRMYYKNYFALYILYSGPSWKNHEYKFDSACEKRHNDAALDDSVLPLYRHQALVASEHPSLRLGFPPELLALPILLINPFPPMDEWTSPSLIERARQAFNSLLNTQ